MRRRLATIVLVVLIVGFGVSLRGMAAPPAERMANTLEVGTSTLCAYHTIQDAIAAAQPGDTIKVQNTLFAEQPLLIEKDLRLAGSYNSAHPYGCLTLTGYAWTQIRRTGTTPAPILKVRNARVTVTWITFEQNSYGSGVAVEDGILFLENVILQDNAALAGGGLSVIRSRATLIDTEILDNSATFGGGLYADQGSTVTTHSSTIRSNNGWDQGAGIFVRGASAFSAKEGTVIGENRTPMDCEEGGGVYADGVNTQVTIDASQVLSNTALSRGGGLYIGGGAGATIQNGSSVEMNVAFGPVSGAGGGIHVSGTGSTLHVTDQSMIYYNFSDPVGGGIYNNGGTVHLNGAYLILNDARDSGGGLYNTGGSVYARDTWFYLNRVQTLDGGGLYSAGAGGTLDLERCTIRSNTAPAGDGGGLYASHPFSSVRESYFVDNEALGEGSALYLDGGCCTGNPAAEVVNSFIVDNSTAAVPRNMGPPGSGSSLHATDLAATLVHNTVAHKAQASFGVSAGPDSTLYMTNNILSGFAVGIRRPSGGTGTVTASYTFFHNNLFDYDTTGVSIFNPVYGNPAFVSSTDYHLTGTSDAINHGTNAGVAFDFDGESRPWGGGYDIGADEYPPRMRAFLPLAMRK